MRVMVIPHSDQHMVESVILNLDTWTTCVMASQCNFNLYFFLISQVWVFIQIYSFVNCIPLWIICSSLCLIFYWVVVLHFSVSKNPLHIRKISFLSVIISAFKAPRSQTLLFSVLSQYHSPAQLLCSGHNVPWSFSCLKDFAVLLPGMLSPDHHTAGYPFLFSSKLRCHMEKGFPQTTQPTEDTQFLSITSFSFNSLCSTHSPLIFFIFGVFIVSVYLLSVSPYLEWKLQEKQGLSCSSPGPCRLKQCLAHSKPVMQIR